VRIKHWIATSVFLISSLFLLSQEEQYFSGLSGSIDLDHLADFMIDGPYGDKNYQFAMRGTIHGNVGGLDVLFVPKIRQWIDNRMIFPFLDELLYRPDISRHQISLILEGFTPAYISDETELYPFAVSEGYSLTDDRPFSSFFGLKFSKDYHGHRIQAKSARKMDIKINTSLAIGFAGTGLINELQAALHRSDSFGASRPEPNLWKRDSSKDIPTGEVLPSGFPLVMYSVEAQANLFRPVSFLQVDGLGRVDAGYQTGLAAGLEIGKTKKGMRTLSSERYSNTVSPVPFLRSKELVAFNFVAGAQAEFVLYNSHLNGLFSILDRHHIGFHETKRFVFEGYASANVQLLRSVEVHVGLNARTAEFKNASRDIYYWMTLGAKLLMPRFGY